MIKILKSGIQWFESRGWKPFDFQLKTWKAYNQGKSGMVNAPTGSGKTYSLLVPIILESSDTKEKKGLKAIWITPIRALSKEIDYSANELIKENSLKWKVGIRTGDTSPKQRERQFKNPPDLLITTPESLHILLTQKNHEDFFKTLKVVVADEWHELMGSKRGVQVELALSRLKSLAPGLRIWGISATIGNMDQSLQTLLGSYYQKKNHKVIRSDIEKEVEIISILPDEVERLPWSGHLGAHLIDKVIPIIKGSGSTLIFTNTRSFAEIWYHKLLDRAPELAGVIAMHHSSISQEMRSWVEDQLHEGKLKAVVCTSSLDLGVDFRPVETVVQVGSPKGVARFLQRAGRSGHQPGTVSRIYFLPTHSLELVEGAALREAVKRKIVEDRIPYIRSFDVLIQYLVTLAVGGGFNEKQIFDEVKGCFSFQSIDNEEWAWVLNFIVSGGESLTAYDEYRKVVKENGQFKVESKAVATRHKLSIGTIVGDSSLWVKMLSGKFLGTIEESFISRMHPGDVFWFGGRNLELVRVKGMEAQVRKSKRKSGMVPSWQGGRMPLSSQLSEMLRLKISEASKGSKNDVEISFLKPLMDLQKERSHIPHLNEFLIEYTETSEGFHVHMFPFEGRFVHEGMAALMAYRIAQIQPITFSIAMNDYGFELLSDQEIPIEEAVETNVLGIDDLSKDIQASINATEMARRKFRDIASISGLVFKGYPGKPVKDRHLQSSSQLFFDVFHDYDSHNYLLTQAYEEVMDFQLEEQRLRKALTRIQKQKIIITRPDKPTPFAFPIMVDRLREKLTTERIEDRIKKMNLAWR